MVDYYQRAGFSEAEAKRFRAMSERELPWSDPRFRAARNAYEKFSQCYDIEGIRGHLTYLGMEMHDMGSHHRIPGVCRLIPASGRILLNDAGGGFPRLATLYPFYLVEDWERVVDGDFVSTAPRSLLIEMIRQVAKVHETCTLGPDMCFLTDGTRVALLGTVLPLNEDGKEQNKMYLQQLIPGIDLSPRLEDVAFHLTDAMDPRRVENPLRSHTDFLTHWEHALRLGRSTLPRNTSDTCYLGCALALAMRIPRFWERRAGLLAEVVAASSEMQLFTENDTMRRMVQEHCQCAAAMFKTRGAEGAEAEAAAAAEVEGGLGGGFVELAFLQLVFPREAAVAQAHTLRYDSILKGRDFVVYRPNAWHREDPSTPLWRSESGEVQKSDGYGNWGTRLPVVAMVLHITGSDGVIHVCCVVEINKKCYFLDDETSTPMPWYSLNDGPQIVTWVKSQDRYRLDRVIPLLYLYQG